MGLTLNLGCGPDSWGDVRVDLDYHTQTGFKTRLNVRADAHSLPFRDKVFEQVKCFHVLEHVNNPFTVLREVRRVGKRFELRFPIGDGYKREMVSSILSVSPNLIMNAYRTRKRNAHLWTIDPSALGLTGTRGRRRVFDVYGRKSKLLGRALDCFTWEVEWIVKESS